MILHDEAPPLRDRLLEELGGLWGGPKPRSIVALCWSVAKHRVTVEPELEAMRDDGLVIESAPGLWEMAR